MSIKGRIKFRTGILKSLQKAVLGNARKEAEKRAVAEQAAGRVLDPATQQFIKDYDAAEAAIDRLEKNTDAKPDTGPLERAFNALAKYNLSGVTVPAGVTPPPVTFSDFIHKYYKPTAGSGLGVIARVENLLAPLEDEKKPALTEKVINAALAGLSEQDDKLWRLSEDVKTELERVGVADASEQAAAMYDAQSKALDELTKDANREFYQQKETNVHQKISAKALGEATGAGDKFDINKLNDYVFNMSTLGAFWERRETADQKLDDEGNSPGIFTALGAKLARFIGPRKGIWGGAFTDRGFKLEMVDGYLTARKQGYRGAGGGFPTVAEQEIALGALIMALGEQMRQKYGPDISGCYLDLKIPNDPRLKRAAMRFAVQAGFRPNKVYSKFERDDRADHKKRVDPELKDIARDFKDYVKEGEELWNKLHTETTASPYDSQRAVDRQAESKKEADGFTPPITRSVDEASLKTESSAAAMAVRPNSFPPALTNPTIFLATSKQEQQRLIERASPAQIAAAVFNPNISLTRKAELLEGIAPERQAIVFAKYLHSTRKEFDDTLVVINLLEKMKEQQSGDTFNNSSFRIFQAMMAENNPQMNEVFPAGSPLKEEVAKQFIRCLPESAQTYVVEKAAEQNYLNAYPNLKDPLSVYITKRKTAAKDVFSSMSKTDIKDKDLDVFINAGNQLDGVTKLLERSLNWEVKDTNKTKLKLFNNFYNLLNLSPRGPRHIVQVLNQSAHPGELVKRFLTDASDDLRKGRAGFKTNADIAAHVKSLLDEPTLNASVKADILTKIISGMEINRVQGAVSPAKAFKAENADAYNKLNGIVTPPSVAYPNHIDDFVGNTPAADLAKIMLAMSDKNAQVNLFKLLREDLDIDANPAAHLAPPITNMVSRIKDVLNDVRDQDPILLGRLLSTYVDHANKINYQPILDYADFSKKNSRAVVEGLLAANPSKAKEIYQQCIAKGGNNLLVGLAANVSKLDKADRADLLDKIAAHNDVPTIKKACAEILSQKDLDPSHRERILKELISPRAVASGVGVGAIVENLSFQERKACFNDFIRMGNVANPEILDAVVVILSSQKLAAPERKQLLEAIPQPWASGSRDEIISKTFLNLASGATSFSMDVILLAKLLAETLPSTKRMEKFDELLGDANPNVASLFFAALLSNNKPPIAVADIANMFGKLALAMTDLQLDKMLKLLDSSHPAAKQEILLQAFGRVDPIALFRKLPLVEQSAFVAQIHALATKQDPRAITLNEQLAGEPGYTRYDPPAATVRAPGF